jgi:two-component system, cell cycle sensor histidine kinase and response regulator CckA
MKYTSLSKKQLLEKIIQIENQLIDKQPSEKSHKKDDMLIRSFASNFHGVVFVIDNKGIFQLSEGKGLAELGLKPGQVVGLSAYDVYKDVPQIKKDIQKTLKGKEHTSFVNVGSKVYETNFQPIYDKKKSITGILGVSLNVTERIESDNLLRESEERFKSYIENAPFGIFVSDKKGYFKEVNKIASKITGYSKEELLNKHLYELIPPNDLSKAKRHFQRVLTRGTSEADFSYLKKDGSVNFWTVGAVKISQNAYLGFVNDITQRKRIEEESQINELRFKSFFSMAAEGIMIHENGIILDANQAFINMLGFNNLDEVIGKRGLDVINFTEKSKQLIASHMKIGSTEAYDVEIMNPDMSILSMETEGREVKYSGRNVRIAYLRDITSRKKAEEALKQSEEKYRHLIQHSGDAIYLLFNRKFELINDKFQEIFGITLEEANNKDFDFINMVAPKSRDFIEDRVRRQSKGENVDSKYEFTGLNSKGQEIELEASVTYIKYKGDEAVQGILRDITDRKRLENQLRQSQKMEAVGQLAGGIAHDFNNLLTVINGYSELLTLRDLSPEMSEPINQILNAGKKATQLTSQLLAFSRKQIIQTKSLNLNTIISNQLKMLQRLLGEDIIINSDLNPKLKNVNADQGQIEQIIMNIAINARDAMPFGGKLILETDNVQITKKNMPNNPEIKPGKYILIKINDNGVGMDSETQSRIFEPFYTTKGRDKGTGLGLATVYGIVKQNNGFVYVDSEPGKGSIFTIYLPKIEKNDDTIEDRDKLYIELQGSETILLVEDDPSVREVTRSSLVSYGYEIITAENGNDALKKYKSNSRNIDLLLTDVIMPQMGGRELAEKLLDLNPNLKILYFSGYTDDNIIKRGVMDDGMEFIQKPFSSTNLAGKIKDILSNK